VVEGKEEDFLIHAKSIADGRLLHDDDDNQLPGTQLQSMKKPYQYFSSARYDRKSFQTC